MSDSHDNQDGQDTGHLTRYYNGVAIQELPPGPEPTPLTADVPGRYGRQVPDHTLNPQIAVEFPKHKNDGTYHVRPKYS